MKQKNWFRRAAAGALALALIVCTSASTAGSAVESGESRNWGDWDIGGNQLNSGKYGRDWHYYSNDQKSNSSTAQKAADAKLVGTRQWGAAGLTSIECSFMVERITLLASPTKDIILKEYHSYSNAAYRAEAKTQSGTSGGTLKVKGGNPPKNIWYSSYIELYVPSGYTGSIRLGSMCGDVEASSFRSRLDASTVSGNVTAAGAGITGQLSSTSGNVTVSNSGGALSVSSVSGDITVSNNAATKAQNVSGDTSIKITALTGDLHANSTSGNVNITLPKDAAFRVSLSSVSGDFTNAFPGSWKQADGIARRSVTGSCGSNPAYTVSGRSVSGCYAIMKAA